MSNLSILIQGPLNLVNLRKCLPSYQKHGQVIVSCYDNDRDKINIQEFPNVRFVYNPVIQVTWANHANLYLHSYTTLTGLLACDTPQVIKTRSDEYFLDLTEVIKRMAADKNKWITHSVWFKKVEKEWLHPGDHLIGATTEALRHTFGSVMTLCRQYSDTQKQFNIYELGFRQQFNGQYQSGLLFPENVFFLYYLQYWYGKELEKYLLLHNSVDGFREVMKQYADIVPFEMLGQFCCTYLTTDLKRVFHSNPEDIYNDPVACDSPIIKDIKEV